ADAPTKWQKLIKSGDASDYGGHRSDPIAGIIAALVRRGWSDDDILPLLVDERYGSSAHCRGIGDPVGAATGARWPWCGSGLKPLGIAISSGNASRRCAHRQGAGGNGGSDGRQRRREPVWDINSTLPL